jgi:7-cyano-7-deazaguanine synthase
MVAAARQFLNAVARPSLSDLVVLELPLADLYGRHWSITCEQVPDETSGDAAVFMPGRNPLLLIKPAIWCAMHGIEQLAIATLSNNPFDDATPDFFSRFEDMIRIAFGVTVQIIRPFERVTKRRVLELGRHLPLELTFSCLSPVGDEHCGCCNKCAERRAAFEAAGIDDPTRYAAIFSGDVESRESPLAEHLRLEPTERRRLRGCEKSSPAG